MARKDEDYVWKEISKLCEKKKQRKKSFLIGEVNLSKLKKRK